MCCRLVKIVVFNKVKVSQLEATVLTSSETHQRSPTPSASPDSDNANASSRST